MKFPCILQEKLKNNDELQFPENTQYEYEKIYGYRCIRRATEDNTPIDRSDFRSNIETSISQGQKIRKRRAQDKEPEDDINYYGTSLFEKKEMLANVMHLPKPSKKICSGYVFMEGGPQVTDGNYHINWWVYEEADLSGFKIEES